MERALAHDIPAVILDLGLAPYFEVQRPTALQMRPPDQQRVLSLIDQESLDSEAESETLNPIINAGLS